MIRHRPSGALADGAAKRPSLSCVLAAACVGTAAAQAPTVTFTPTSGVPTFAKREPVLRVAPGTIVETRTFSKPGDYYEPAAPGPWPGEVGPFYIEGATPTDTLVVKILRVRLNRDTAISAINPTGISGLAADGRTRMMNDPLPARRWVWKLLDRRISPWTRYPLASSSSAR